MPGLSPGWEKSVCAAALLLIRSVGKIRAADWEKELSLNQARRQVSNAKKEKGKFLARRGCAWLSFMSLVSHWIE